MCFFSICLPDFRVYPPPPFLCGTRKTKWGILGHISIILFRVPLPPPPTHFLGGKRLGAELASHLSVGDGAVSEAGKGVLYIGKLMGG